MKTLTLSPLSLILISLLSFSQLSFGGNKKHVFGGHVKSEEKDLFCIEIDGKVRIPKSDPSKTYKIELLCHNTVVDSGLVVDGESFLLKIKKNSWYTIRIVKEGYFPQIVSIDTRVPEYNTESHKFHFDTELIIENYATIGDKDAIDFPIAIISFNTTNDLFTPVREYSKNIKSSLFEQTLVTSGYVEK